MLHILLNDRLKAGTLRSVFLVQKLVKQKIAIGDRQPVPKIFSSPNSNWLNLPFKFLTSTA